MVIAPKVSSYFFHWSGNRGVAYASDPALDRITGKPYYDDSADEGFIVISTKTGKEVGFTFAYDKRPHGELEAEVYTSLCGKYRIDIIND